MVGSWVEFGFMLIECVFWCVYWWWVVLVQLGFGQCMVVVVQVQVDVDLLGVVVWWYYVEYCMVVFDFVQWVC